MEFPPLLISVLMMMGVVLFFVGLTRPQPTESSLESRLMAYAARPPSLSEIELQRSISERIFKPILSRLTETISKRTPQRTLEEIRRNLDAAGNPNNLTVADYLGLRGFGALFIGVGAFLMASLLKAPFLGMILAPLGGAVVGSYLPGFWLNGKIGARQKEFQLSLPDALDLLTISVEAGLGFDQALQKVAEKWDNALTREFARVLREQRMGISRRDALRAMAQRAKQEDVNAFISAIIQADQLGVSIARILVIQSEQMRMKRRQRAEKLAHEAPLKMTFPMVLFMMPALWIIILGPMVPFLAGMMGGK